VGTVLLFIFLSRLILKIEGLDKFAWAFDKAREKLLSGVATDERGPPSFKPGAPPRHDSPNLQSNLQRAEMLLPSFVEDVLKGLSRSSGGDQPRVIKYNVKQVRADSTCQQPPR
jgi:hypothetical protein